MRGLLPVPLQDNRGSLVITSSQNFSLTFQLKDTLATEIKPNYYTQVHAYQVLKQEAGVCFTAKLNLVMYFSV